MQFVSTQPISTVFRAIAARTLPDFSAKRRSHAARILAKTKEPARILKILLSTLVLAPTSSPVPTAKRPFPANSSLAPFKTRFLVRIKTIFRTCLTWKGSRVNVIQILQEVLAKLRFLAKILEKTV